MEEAILRRDFQTFAKLTMQVQLDYITQDYRSEYTYMTVTHYTFFVYIFVLVTWMFALPSLTLISSRIV